MAKTVRTILALGAFFVLAVALSACGSSNTVPPNAVASVDGKAITKSTYQHVVETTTKGAATQGISPDPPTYAKCIAALRKQAKAVKGPKPTDAALKSQCENQYKQITQQALTTLIQSLWIEGEANNLNVSANESEVQKQLQTIKKQSFPNEKAYQSFLKQSGMTTADVLARVKVQTLAQKITQKIEKGAGSPSESEISKYYKQHESQFAVPQRRDLQVVLAKSQAKANEAKAAIESGTPWKEVAKKDSIDPISKNSGGTLQGVTEQQEDPKVAKAVFSAKKGQLLGPLHGQTGWYVVRVTGITAPKQTTLSEAKAQIKAQLAQQNQQKKMSTFVTSFQKRWKDKTNCRTGYIIALCKNAPKQKTTSSASTVTASSK